MYMTEREILRSYEAGRFPKAQVKILSELNMCSVEEIIAILEKLGANVDKARPKARSSRIRKM